ncbi:MAG: type 4a pilus biogenesis protein PilO [Acidobacteria bacterium]|nr:type 4a pilus biogenesis protein PilO [Acidobacteriota bacterium]
MDNLSPKAQAAVLIILLVLIVAIGYFAVFKDWYQQIDSTKAQITKVESDIRKGRALQAKINEFNRQINDLKRKLAKLKGIMPSTLEAGKLYGNLNRMANDNQVYIVSIKADKRISTDVYTELPYNLKLRARYNDVGHFFANLANFPKILNVKSLEMKKLKTDNSKYSIAVNCTVSTFIYNEKTDISDLGGGAK